MRVIMDLIELFNARRGIVCVVGAGGKKTTIYKLAAAHPGRVAITATAHIPRFPAGVVDALLADISTADQIAARAPTAGRVVALVGAPDKPNRYAGLAPELIAAGSAGAVFDVWLVKADGARARLIKAPAADEPAFPPGTTTVIPVVSARAIGRALDATVAHRPEQVAAVTGASLGRPLTPEHIGRLLAAPQGALKGVGDAQVIPLINMVDDAAALAGAREAARIALTLTDRYRRIVLANMSAGRVVAVEET